MQSSKQQIHRRLEIVVPSVVRIGIWFKQTFPFLINPIIGNAFRKAT